MVTDQRTAVDWVHQIRNLVDVEYPRAERITLVMDNLNTHTGASLYKAFAPKEARRILDKLEIHYTPKHGSWLNTEEIELSILSRQCLDRRIPDQETLREHLWMIGIFQRRWSLILGALLNHQFIPSTPDDRRHGPSCRKSTEQLDRLCGGKRKVKRIHT